MGDRQEQRQKAQQVFNNAHQLRQQERRQEAAAVFDQALELAPEELRGDRTWKAFAAYQAGLNLMTLHGLDAGGDERLMDGPRRAALEDLRSHWTRMMDLVTSVNRQDVRGYDTTPNGQQPILSTAIRTVVEDPLIAPALKPAWLHWTRRYLGWPLADEAPAGVTYPDTLLDRLIHRAMVLNKETPGTTDQVRQTQYSQLLLDEVVRPLYMFYCDLFGEELDDGLDELSPAEMDQHLNATMEGGIQVFICHQHGDRCLDQGTWVQTLSMGRQLCDLNLRLVGICYGEDMDGHAASRAILEVYGQVILATAVILKDSAAALEAERMFAFFGFERAVHACRDLVQKLTHD